MCARCHLADSVSRAGSASAITWKIFSPVSRDPGNAIPGSRQTGLRIFHVIAKLNFRVFNRCVEIPANRASPANRAIPAHVIRPLVSSSDLKNIVKSRSRILDEGLGVSAFTILYPYCTLP